MCLLSDMYCQTMYCYANLWEEVEKFDLVDVAETGDLGVVRCF